MDAATRVANRWLGDFNANERQIESLSEIIRSEYAGLIAQCEKIAIDREPCDWFCPHAICGMLRELRKVKGEV